MIEIRHYQGHLWGIRSDRYSKALHIEAKKTPGLRWQPQERAWCGYIDAAAVCIERLRKQGIIVQGSASGATGRGPARQAWQGNAYSSLRDPRLRDYQKSGIQFLVDHAATGALLADDMGLGKSVQALKAIEVFAGPALIVCPSFVRHVWLGEAAKWLPQIPVVQLSGTKPDLGLLRDSERCVYLIHYDIVHAWVEPLVLTGIETLICDECHFLMGDRSRRSKAVREIARKCKYRVGLSGTPMTSRPRDLWNPVDTLSEGRFGRPFDFYIRHADAHLEEVAAMTTVWVTTGASNLDELHRRLSYFMLRRTKSDVALELPPRTRQVIEVDVQREYRAPIGNALKNDQALREALTLAADGKIPLAVDLVASHAEGSKVVVFTHRRIVAEEISTALKAQGIDAAFVTGDIGQARRHEIIGEKHTVLCATMDSTQVGIDLSYADVAVFVELDWVPSKLSQCESRLHRFGQKKNVLIQYVIALSTADEVIAQVCIDKLDNFEQGVGRLDDRLKEDLSRVQMDTAEQLRRLYEKLVRQDSNDASGNEVRSSAARAPSEIKSARKNAMAGQMPLRENKDRAGR